MLFQGTSLSHKHMVHYFGTSLRSQTKREKKEIRQEEEGKGWAGRGGDST